MAFVITHTHTYTHTSTADASCDASCPEGAGCLGPGDSALCGTCLQDGDLNTCLIGPTPSSSSSSDSCDSEELTNTAGFGVLYTVIAIAALILLAVAIYGGIKLYKKMKEGRKGIFNVNVSQ